MAREGLLRKITEPIWVDVCRMLDAVLAILMIDREVARARTDKRVRCRECNFGWGPTFSYTLSIEGHPFELEVCLSTDEDGSRTKIDDIQVWFYLTRPEEDTALLVTYNAMTGKWYLALGDDREINEAVIGLASIAKLKIDVKKETAISEAFARLVVMVGSDIFLRGGVLSPRSRRRRRHRQQRTR